MAQSFHNQTRKLVIPANKQDAYVYKAGSKGLKRDSSKQREGVWNAEPKSLEQYPLRENPVKLWVFFYDHLENADILQGILDNNPNQGEFGYTCQNPRTAKPEEMVFCLPKTKLPESYKPGGIWVHPVHKLENLTELDDGATGFMAMGDYKEKAKPLDVGGRWEMMGHHQKVVKSKNKARVNGRRSKITFGVKIRNSKGETFPVTLPSNLSKVHKLRDKINAQMGIPSEEQRLSFNGTKLEDNKTLKEYGIKDGDIIDLDPMKVYVKNPAGKRFLFGVEPDEKVESLMDMVEKKMGTPAEQQVLSFYRRKLDPSKNLKKYRIKHMNVIDLALGKPVKKTRFFVEVPESPDSEGNPRKNKIELMVVPTKTFGHIKKLVEEQIGMSKARQRVFFQDKEIDDKKSISKVKLQDGDTIRIEQIPEPEIEVKLPDGTTRHFVFDSEETVEEFKEKHKTDFPPGTKLMLSDIELVDEKPLGKYNLKKGDVLVAEPDEVEIDTPRGKVKLSSFSTLKQSDIKDVIEEQTGVPKSQQRLFFFDEELVDDDKPLDKVKLKALGSGGLRMELIPTEDEADYLTPKEPSKGRAFYLSEPEEMEVMLPNRKKIVLSISPTMTVSELKAVVEEMIPDMDGTKQRLFFLDNCEIDNKTPISKVMFNKGSPLEVRPFEITIKQRDGECFELYPDPLEYLDDVKDRIKAFTNIPPDRQIITHKGSSLDETVTLAAQGIKHKSELQLESMEVFFDVPDGRRITIPCQFNEEVRSIKEKLENAINESAKRQCILLGSDLLEDADTLDAVGVDHGDILRMELFQVNFLHWLGYEFSINVFMPNSTVPDMKEFIEETKLILKEDQKFELDGRVLNENETLQRQGVKHKSLLLLQEGKKIEIALPKQKKIALTIFPTTTIAEMKKIIEKKIPALTAKKQRLFVFEMDDEINDETPVSKLKFDAGHPLELRPFEITVNHWNGNSFGIISAPSEYIEDVKETLKGLTGIKAISQRISHNGEKVDDTLRLEEQGIVHGSILLLEQMRISVRVPGGRQIRLRAEQTDTIKLIKKKVAKKTGQPYEKQSILLAGEDLDDKMTLESFDIDHGDEVTMERFEIEVIDSSDGSTMTLYDVARSDTIDVLRQQIWENFNIRVGPKQLFWQQNPAPLQCDSRLKELGIPHKAILIIQSSSKKAAEYKADRLSFNNFFSKKVFQDVEDELMMPVEPDWRKRIFIFDNNTSPVDGHITISTLHWSGKKYTFEDVRPRETIKDIMIRITLKKTCPPFNLLLNGKVLKESRTLLDEEIGHKSILVLEEKKKKTIYIPQASKMKLGLTRSHLTSKITVEIKLWNGKLLGLRIGATEYPDDIRDELERQISIPVDYQHLSRDGRPLDDILALNKQGITDGCYLVLERLKIQIKLPFESKLTLKVEPEDTIASIKKKIETQSSFASMAQCLLFQGKLLKDSERIMDYQIQHQDELVLELFAINILQLKGNRITISDDIHPGSTIAEVQEVIAKKQLIPTHLQNFRFHGKILNPNMKLSRQGIIHKSILVLDVSTNNIGPAPIKSEKVRLLTSFSKADESPTIRGQNAMRHRSLDPVETNLRSMTNAAPSQDLCNADAKPMMREGNSVHRAEGTHQAMNNSSNLLDSATATSKSRMQGRKSDTEKGEQSNSTDPVKANLRTSANSAPSLDMTASDDSADAREAKHRPVNDLSQSVDVATASNLNPVKKKRGKRSKSMDPAAANRQTMSQSPTSLDSDTKPVMRRQKKDKKKEKKKDKRSKSVDASGVSHDTKAVKKKRGKRSKSVDAAEANHRTMSQSTTSLDSETAEDTKHAMRRRKKDKKKTKRSKSVGAGEVNHGAMDNSSRSLDWATADTKAVKKRRGKRPSKAANLADSKPIMKGRKLEKKKTRRSKSVDPVDASFREQEVDKEISPEGSEKKRSNSVDGYTMGKLAGRIRTDKATVVTGEEEAPKKRGSSWWAI